MKTKEEIELMLKDAEDVIFYIERFRSDSASLGLNVLENEFLVLKKFYKERVDIFLDILNRPLLPF